MIGKSCTFRPMKGCFFVSFPFYTITEVNVRFWFIFVNSTLCTPGASLPPNANGIPCECPIGQYLAHSAGQAHCFDCPSGTAYNAATASCYLCPFGFTSVWYRALFRSFDLILFFRCRVPRRRALHSSTVTRLLQIAPWVARHSVSQRIKPYICCNVWILPCIWFALSC